MTIVKSKVNNNSIDMYISTWLVMKKICVKKLYKDKCHVEFNCILSIITISYKGISIEKRLIRHK